MSENNELEQLRAAAAPRSRTEQVRLVLTAAVAILAAVLILGMTMWLVPWATMTAAGILIGISVLGIAAIAIWALRVRESRILAEKKIDRKDEAVRAVRARAMALVGKIAVAGLLCAAVILCLIGKIGTTAFCLTAVGFLALCLLAGAVTWVLEKKL